MNLTLEELEDIWKDAKFEPKKPILKSAEIIKKEKLEKLVHLAKQFHIVKYVIKKRIYQTLIMVNIHYVKYIEIQMIDFYLKKNLKSSKFEKTFEILKFIFHSKF